MTDLALWAVLIAPLVLIAAGLLLDAVWWKNAYGAELQELLDDTFGRAGKHSNIAVKLGILLGSVVALLLLLAMGYVLLAAYLAAMFALVGLTVWGTGELIAIVFGDFTASAPVTWGVLGVIALLVATVSIALAREKADEWTRQRARG